MIVELNIKNFAIIDSLKINFSEGLNVITGETGAGKSIVVDAINLILGSRANKDLIRTGCDRAILEGLFYIENSKEIDDILEKYGIEKEDNNSLLLSREIFSTGRSVSRINGQTVTLNILNDVTQKLIDIHGQHEHQSLLNVGSYIKLIDDFGDDKFNILKKKISEEYNQIVSLKGELKKLSIDSKEKDREIDLLKYEIEEIDSAKLSDGEEKKVYDEYNKMSNIKNISLNVGEIINILDSEDYNSISVSDGINKSISLMNSVKRYDEDLNQYSSALENVNFEIQDISRGLKNYIENTEFDEERLAFLEERLNLIYKIKKKYGNSLEEILNYKNSISERLYQLINNEKEIERINKKIEETENELNKNSTILSEMRKKIAKKLESDISKELHTLNIKNSIFKINFKKMKYYGEEGFDIIEFLISTNLGEELKPLSKIVSGGEMSRIMLAFKTVIAKYDRIPCLIFDEIDAGISGRTAQIVGEKIYKISKGRQVICISHLPQIAALADTHFSIKKEIVNGRTSTKVKILNYEERIAEMSRLLGGVNLTDTTKLHAKEMLEMSKKFKKIT
ncbi:MULTISPECIES: DNA repair protein RecN [Tissierellales]|jgi:DNA repair protein RecN (Recombination protein N)|uniref:DNA repair protein RecN n=1 Tax=Acidilutibacter cellobiosedens TaxID=2507161 RepID=A0A410QCN0_9FIRM|nr:MULTISPECIES: DNA repair protein RecN [Tissierellales]QAT61757.1 DNA repair protein RecN [Acidilutibacter cellobiosedens]SCL82375.1 Recombination protein N [Sporanaerobacter sp. PP17-6a]